VRTGLGGGNKGLYSRIMGLMPKLMVGPLALNSAGGARTSIYLASSPEVAGVSGEYFAKSKIAKYSDRSHDEAAAGQLWEASAALTGVAV
jgi:retinol dehydrogenase-12